MESERRMGYWRGGLHSPVGVVGEACCGAVGHAPDVSTWRIESPPLTVSAGEAAGHHDLVTGVQELVRFKAHYAGATPVLREDCPYVVHHTVGAMPSSAIWHALAVFDPLDIRSQDSAGNIEFTATERLVGVPKCGHIRLRHRSIHPSQVTNLRLCKGPLLEPLTLSFAAEPGEEERILISDRSVLADNLSKRSGPTGRTCDGLPVLLTALNAALPGRRGRRLGTGRCGGGDNNPQGEHCPRCPTSNAHALSQLIYPRADLAGGT
jgi:hypothetical protein